MGQVARHVAVADRNGARISSCGTTLCRAEWRQCLSSRGRSPPGPGCHRHREVGQYTSLRVPSHMHLRRPVRHLLLAWCLPHSAQRRSRVVGACANCFMGV
eukprot:2466483-Rhodomonas_salina.1